MEEKYKPLTCEEIAKIYDVSPKLIKKIEKQALDKLRKNEKLRKWFGIINNSEK